MTDLIMTYVAVIVECVVGEYVARMKWLQTERNQEVAEILTRMPGHS
jgi:hypothetical protein